METVLDRLWSGIACAEREQAAVKTSARPRDDRHAACDEAEWQARFFTLKA